jgi:hypothetical protein
MSEIKEFELEIRQLRKTHQMEEDWFPFQVSVEGLRLAIQED